MKRGANVDAGRGDGTLGEALRRWRDRLDPSVAGVRPGRIRRVSGLRREELALLAGLSVDYVVRLEQGRAKSPSPQVLTAIARVLRLTEAERQHLFLLAGKATPGRGRLSSHIPPGVWRLLGQMESTPVSMYDAAWTLLHWNRPYAALMGDPAGLPARELNVLWRHFTGLSGRVSHTPEQSARFETAAVADLRAATARYPADLRLGRLAAELRARSDRFAELWESHVVGVHTSDSKTVHHPDAGALTVDCDVVTSPGTDIRIVVHTAAAGSDAAEKLRLITGVGAAAG